MNTSSTLCSFRRAMLVGPVRPFRLFWIITVNIISGHPSPVSSLLAPVKLATTFGIQQSIVQFNGSLPAFQAIVPSTKYSGIVCTIATRARASPLLMENSEASAAQAIRRDAEMTAPNVKKATV